MKIISLVLLLFFVISCESLEQVENETIEARVGWMHGNCLAIKSSDMALPRKITLVNLEETNIVSTGVVTNEAKSGEDCYPLLEDRKIINQNNGYHFYNVKSDTPIHLAIGVFEFNEFGNSVFNYCTTLEGILYSVSLGASDIWDGYYYLGYESEVTCESGAGE